MPLIRTLKKFPTILLFFLSLLALQTASGQMEDKPKYAPGKEKHKNKTDEFGRKQGTWLYYNYFGEKILETPWVNDHKEGVEKRFYANKIKEEQEYLGGIKDGTYNKYYFSGQAAIEGQYNYGKKDGKWTKYFEDGSIRQEGSYKMGKKDGVWKTYNRKGAVTGQATYKDDVNVQILEDTKKKEDEKKAIDLKRKEKEKTKAPLVKANPPLYAPANKPPESVRDSLKSR